MGVQRYSAILSLTPVLDLGGRETLRPGRFTPPKRHWVPIVQEAGWAPGVVWTGAENLAPIGIRFSDRPARNYTDYAIPALDLQRYITQCSTLCSCQYSPFTKMITHYKFLT
jgi:hypothetical protein